MNIKYQLFQVKREKTREFGFMGLDMMKRMGVELNAENYVKTYEGEIEDESVDHALEVLFHKFNMERPRDFTNYSMSIGDIVVIDNKSYFCNLFGWTEVEINF